MKHVCVCLDERIAIPKAIKDAVLDDIHSTHPGSFETFHLHRTIGGRISNGIYWQKLVGAKLARN